MTSKSRVDASLLWDAELHGKQPIASERKITLLVDEVVDAVCNSVSRTNGSILLAPLVGVCFP
jgi:hypothetical protein